MIGFKKQGKQIYANMRKDAWHSVMFASGSLLGRGLKKVMHCAYGWPLEGVTNWPIGGLRHSIATNVPASQVFQDVASWLTDTTSNYIIPVNSEGLATVFGFAGISQATISCKGYIQAVSSAVQKTFAEFCTLSGDVRFGLESGGANNRTGAFAAGTTAFGVSAVGSITTGWQDWTMVFNGTLTGNTERLKIYKNGVPVAVTYTGTIPATTAATTRFELGRTFANATGFYAQAYYHQVLLWDRALSPVEVKELATPASAIPSGNNLTCGNMICGGMMATNYFHRLVMPSAMAAAVFRSRSASRATFAGHHRMTGAGQ